MKPRTQRLLWIVLGVAVLAAAAGEKRYCQVNRNSKGMVMLRTFGQKVRVVVVQKAAPNATHKRYLKRTVYVNGKRT